MKKNIAILFVVVLSLLHVQSHAQTNVRDSSLSFGMLGATFQYQIPGGDMAKRFYNNYNVGGVFQWKFKNNWIIGIEGDFMFNESVKESNILDGLRNDQGYIIGEDGQFAEVYLAERGLMFNAKVGKIFPVIGPNPNSGLLISAAGGILQHKIRIEDKFSVVPEVTGDYAKGYDRLTNGLSLTEFIGYVNFANRRLINFYVGFEFTQALTENRRDFNFDEGKRDDTKRMDLLSGIKFGWVIPLYKRVPKDYYYN